MNRLTATFAAIAVAYSGTQATAQTADKFSVITFKSGSDKVEIVDGDTVWIGIHQVRLLGIDAVEPEQVCSKGSVKFDCHAASMNYLGKFTSNPAFRCDVKVAKDGKPAMSYGRYVAICYVGTIEVNHAMVAAGWALAANTQAGDIYRQTEAQASKLKLGLHTSSYEKPWIWRKQKNGDKCTCDSDD